VYAVSDLHADHPENLALLRRQPVRPEDAVLIAGDVSNDVSILRETLEIFVSKFKHVAFCPGNHDLWLHEGDGCKNSLEKLGKILALCEELGVATRPTVVGGGVLLVPLLSWYEPAFDAEPDIVDDWNPPANKAMTDFYKCRWPAGLAATDASLAEHFDSLNAAEAEGGGHEAVISFSHFLPRPELLPEKRFLFFPNLSKAVGSRALGRRVARLRPHRHVFGHSHYGWDAEVDGVRYLQAALAYPKERETRGFSLRLGDEGPVDADAQGGVVSPVLVYDAATRTFPRWSGFWSGHYARHPRRPEDVRWMYRRPRERSAVGRVLRRLVDAGENVDDDIVERLLRDAA